MATEVVRPGAPLYPWAEVGGPEVTTTIDPDITRPGTIYFIPSTGERTENTVGVIIIYGKPVG